LEAHVLTYPHWKLNRQIADGLIGAVAVVVIVAAIVWWKQAEGKKQAGEV
jgi:hypothetical protein